MMKFILYMVYMVVLSVVMTSCGSTNAVAMLKSASPETGAMCIFRFDGENTDAKWIYDEERVKRIIKEITLTYSEGNWLVQDGTVYSASYDMARLYDQIEEKEDTLSRSGIAMPNASILSRHSIKYYRNTDADQVNKNIELSLLGIEENIVTIRLKNITDEECTYGLRFSLQKEIDGKWF